MLIGEFMPEGNADPLAILATIDTSLATINTSLATLLTTPTTIYNGQVTLAAAAVQLSAVSVPIKSVTIENVSTNAVAYVGNATVTALLGYGLRPGATVSMDIDDLNKVYVIGTVGNVVTYIAVT